MKKDIKYTEITKLDTLVGLLGDGDKYIFYIKMGYGDYKVIGHAQLVNAEHKYVVHLMRNSKLFYSQH